MVAQAGSGLSYPHGFASNPRQCPARMASDPRLTRPSPPDDRPTRESARSDGATSAASAGNERPGPLRAVLFDLDGTLVDSAPDLHAALNAVLQRRGLRALSLDEVKSMIGDGAAMLVRRGLAAAGGDAGETDAVLQEFLVVYQAEAVRHTRPYDGVIDTLKHLHRSGLRLAVVTNKPHAASMAVLEGLGMARFFEAVVGGDTAARRKPHPDPVLHALRLMGVAPSQTVMVGDNHHDVAAARAAGVGAVAVTYGYSHVPHAQLGADRLIGRFADLVELAPG